MDSGQTCKRKGEAQNPIGVCWRTSHHDQQHQGAESVCLYGCDVVSLSGFASLSDEIFGGLLDGKIFDGFPVRTTSSVEETPRGLTCMGEEGGPGEDDRREFIGSIRKGDAMIR